jgi:hypothetical protein
MPKVTKASRDGKQQSKPRTYNEKGMPTPQMMVNPVDFLRQFGNDYMGGNAQSGFQGRVGPKAPPSVGSKSVEEGGLPAPLPKKRKGK